MTNTNEACKKCSTGTGVLMAASSPFHTCSDPSCCFHVKVAAQPNAQGAHPAQRDYGVDVFALQAGDIITDEHGNEYRVNPGFKTDRSSCWRDSRYVSCTLLDASRYFPTTYIKPVTVRLAVTAVQS